MMKLLTLEPHLFIVSKTIQPNSAIHLFMSNLFLEVDLTVWISLQFRELLALKEKVILKILSK